MIWSIGAWRSLVSRLVRVQEAPGSNPGAPTKIKRAATAALFILKEMRDSNNQMQLSSEQLLAAGLDGGNTLICSIGANATNPGAPIETVFSPYKSINPKMHPVGM